MLNKLAGDPGNINFDNGIGDEFLFLIFFEKNKQWYIDVIEHSVNKTVSFLKKSMQKTGSKSDFFYYDDVIVRYY